MNNGTPVISMVLLKTTLEALHLYTGTLLSTDKLLLFQIIGYDKSYTWLAKPLEIIKGEILTMRINNEDLSNGNIKLCIDFFIFLN